MLCMRSRKHAYREGSQSSLMDIRMILSTSQFGKNRLCRGTQPTIGYMALRKIVKRCAGSGPRKRRSKGIKRISSKLSRMLVAKSTESRRAWFGWCFRQGCQKGQRDRGLKGRRRRPARSGSHRGETLPPGKQRSPACLTRTDRLLKIMHGPERFPQPGPRRNKTADASTDRAAAGGKKSFQLPGGLSLWMMSAV